MPASTSPFLPAVPHYLIGLAALFLMIEFLRSLPIVSVIKKLATSEMPWPGPPVPGGSGVFSQCFGDLVRTAVSGLVLGSLFYLSGLTPVMATPPSARWILGGFATLTIVTGLVYRTRMRADVRQIRGLMREFT